MLLPPKKTSLKCFGELAALEWLNEEDGDEEDEDCGRESASGRVSQRINPL